MSRKKKELIRCRFTGELVKPIQCHIYPRSFYGIEKGLHLAAIKVGSDKRPTRSWNGTYDEEIIGQKAEDYFSYLDGYACDLLIKDKFDKSPFGDSSTVWQRENGSPIGYIIRGADPARIKLFVLSLLWRAHVTGRREFASVDIGPHYGRLHEMLVNNDAGDPDEFAVNINQKLEESFQSDSMSPYLNRESDSAVNFIDMEIGGFHFKVKVDKRKTPEPRRDFILGMNEDIWVFQYEYLKTTACAKQAKYIRKLNCQFGNPWKGRVSQE